MKRKSVVAGALILSGVLAGCDNAPDVAVPKQDEATAEPIAAPAAQPTETPTSASTAPAAQLDVEALQDRTKPDRLLRFYASAIEAGDWKAAAAAWSLDANVTAQTLQSAHGRGRAVKLAIGNGDREGAAGSLFYVAPVTVQSQDGAAARRGTIVLRRVNDVPGASEEQLNWRIERSSLVTNR